MKWNLFSPLMMKSMTKHSVYSESSSSFSESDSGRLGRPQGVLALSGTPCLDELEYPFGAFKLPVYEKRSFDMIFDFNSILSDYHTTEHINVMTSNLLPAETSQNFLVLDDGLEEHDEQEHPGVGSLGHFV